jgi:hypothetical protein
MKYLLRLLKILAGYFTAAAAGLIAPAAFIFIGVPNADNLNLSSIKMTISVLIFLVFQLGGALLIPALFVIAICEALRIRNILVYTTLGVLVAAGLVTYTIGANNYGELFNIAIAAVTGTIAGFVYWRIAGRNAGAWRGVVIPHEPRRQ